jgi:hypothetical protein
MPFGTATVITNVGAAVQAKRLVGATPTQAEPKYCAMGVGATGAARTAAVGDTALSTEVETRTTGAASTVTTTQTNDTYQCVGTVAATTSRAVDEAGLFDQSAAGGNLMLSATFPVQNLLSGDSIQFTWKTKFVPG